MQRPRAKLFASATFAPQKNRRATAGSLLQLLHHRVHRRTIAHHAIRVISQRAPVLTPIGHLQQGFDLLSQHRRLQIEAQIEPNGVQQCEIGVHGQLRFRWLKQHHDAHRLL